MYIKLTLIIGKNADNSKMQPSLSTCFGLLGQLAKKRNDPISVVPHKVATVIVAYRSCRHYHANLHQWKHGFSLSGILAGDQSEYLLLSQAMTILKR